MSETLTRDKKIKDWEDQQRQLFLEACIPQQERYSLSWGEGNAWCAESSTSEHKRELLECREYDKTFYYHRFQLPLKIVHDFIHLYRVTDPSVSAQLQHDLDHAQRQWHKSGIQSEKRESNTEEVTAERDLYAFPPPLSYVGGMDISFFPNNPNRGVVCLVVLQYPSLEVVHVFMEECVLLEEYIVGFLAFREVPLLQRLWENAFPTMQKEGCVPQLVVLDGCGTHHIRRAGLAVQLGVRLGIATIGCAKNMLFVGEVGADEVVDAMKRKKEWVEGREKETGRGEMHGSSRGQRDLPAVPVLVSSSLSSASTRCFSPMTERKKVVQKTSHTTFPCVLHPPDRKMQFTSIAPVVYPIVGYSVPPILYGYAALTSPSPKKCIFISPGNHVGYAASVVLVLSMCCCRIPEPTRLADFYSREFIRQTAVVATPSE